MLLESLSLQIKIKDMIEVGEDFSIVIKEEKALEIVTMEKGEVNVA